ncbi:ficolin-1-like isoform X2 [Pomacea canaliculata]|uniref:ficolin-1-like isoform X2 n=1 Tax=Pomacea canaliculata TaxID=400727 RepID=UPI000D72A9DA|nr:ficolin-1-like isoform X2 [Pomacea canaliculata]
MLRFFFFLLCVSPCLLTQTTESEKSRHHGNSSKPHDWSTSSCVTDEECDNTNAVCYVNKCRCRPGLFFSATYYICSATCSTEDLHNTFMEYPDSGLKGHILEIRDGLSLEDCKKLCLSTKRCLTFDFRDSAVRGLCVLHDVTARESPSEWYPKTGKGWTHYQRSCLTKFASYPVWYNLLCYNDLDCPDPYSQCLTGRCVCSSGKVFSKNEASCRLRGESCQTWQENGGKTGVYSIQPADNKENLTVWCDMDSGDGGWLVFQRRRDGSVDFYRNWTDYENGFGDVTGEFWLGLSRLYRLTKDKPVRLRVDLREVNGESHYAEYSSFSVGGPETNYRLNVSGYSGTAGDSMEYQNTLSFTTNDRDNDKYPDNCAAVFHGAWWYNDCHTSHLNGLYKVDGAVGYDAIIWYYVHNDWRSFTFSEMKLKPA